MPGGEISEASKRRQGNLPATFSNEHHHGLQFGISAQPDRPVRVHCVVLVFQRTTMRKRVYKYKDRREYHRQWDAKRAADGICRCGKKSSCGVRCDECRERRRKQKEAARRADGVPMKDPLGCNWLRPGDMFESKTSVILRITRIVDQVVHFTRNGFVKTSPLGTFCHAIRDRYTKITP